LRCLRLGSGPRFCDVFDYVCHGPQFRNAYDYAVGLTFVKSTSCRGPRLCGLCYGCRSFVMTRLGCVLFCGTSRGVISALWSVMGRKFGERC